MNEGVGKDAVEECVILRHIIDLRAYTHIHRISASSEELVGPGALAAARNVATSLLNLTTCSELCRYAIERRTQTKRFKCEYRCVRVSYVYAPVRARARVRMRACARVHAEIQLPLAPGAACGAGSMQPVPPRFHRPMRQRRQIMYADSAPGNGSIRQRGNISRYLNFLCFPSLLPPHGAEERCSTRNKQTTACAGKNKLHTHS